jgi:hypothetical protein
LITLALVTLPLIALPLVTLALIALAALRTRAGHWPAARARAGRGRPRRNVDRAGLAGVAALPRLSARLATGGRRNRRTALATRAAALPALATALTSRLGRIARELLLEPADHRRLDRRGRRTHELAHLFELGHDGLALHTELLREFVNPDLRHHAPLLGPFGGP